MEVIHEASQANEIVENGTESDNCNNRRMRISYRLRPILQLMKLAGEYYGDSSLLETPQGGSSYFSRFYCTSVLLGQSVIFVQAVTSIFFEGFTQMQNSYFLLMFSIWYLECVGINTICLFVLPKSQKQPSRFSKLVSSLFTKEAHLGGLTKQRLRNLLALACCAVVFNSICLAFLDFYQCISVARFQPWNGLLAYRLLHLVFGVFNSFAWVLPALMFCVSCTVLSGMFENLQKKLAMQNFTSINIGSLRQEHHTLCGTVALADKVFSPYLFVVMSLHIPLICFNFHQLLKNSNDDNISYIITILYWWLGLTAEVALILVFGIKVNEKVRVRLVIFDQLFYNLYFSQTTDIIIPVTSVLDNLCSRSFILRASNKIGVGTCIFVVNVYFFFCLKRTTCMTTVFVPVY